MLMTLILVIHVIVCVTLVLMILLQSGKGADIGAVFGGGSSTTVFGAAGAATFLSKVTIVAAITFMCTSIILTYFSGKSAKVQESLITQEQPVAPGAQPAAPVEGAETAVPPVTEDAATDAETVPATEKTPPSGEPATSGEAPTGAAPAPAPAGVPDAKAGESPASTPPAETGGTSTPAEQ